MNRRRIAMLLVLGVYALAASAPCPDPAASASEAVWVQANTGAGSASPPAGEPASQSIQTDRSQKQTIIQMACPCGCRRAPSAISGLGVVQFPALEWAELDPPQSSARPLPFAPVAESPDLPSPDPIPKPTLRLS